jgi:hypothetical protein
MRALLAVSASLILACSSHHNGNGDDANGGEGNTADACIGLECQVVNCEAMGMPATTVSGTVFAPNGTLPLYGVNVYVPRDAVPPFTPGVSCDRCSDSLLGSPIAKATSDEAGKFSLTDVPVGDNIPLIITIGKWRTKLVLPHVAQCTDTPLPAAMTKLPSKKSEGEIPLIGITTGSADALECLILKLGIDPTEITTDAQAGRIHLYADLGAGAGLGVSSFKAGFAGGSGAFSNATTLWNDINKLKNYDILIFSCEGAQHSETKSQPAMDAVEQYTGLGGRVFMSHWHNIWLEGATQDGNPQKVADWTSIGTFDDLGGALPDNTNAVIDETANPKGASFATWMVNVMGSTTKDLVSITGGKNTCTTIDSGKAERWVYLDQQHSNAAGVQNFQFTTPQNVSADQRCGKVVFSDMHVSADSTSPKNGTYPTTCSTAGLTPQEKALAFMFFDISSCVGVIF